MTAWLLHPRTLAVLAGALVAGVALVVVIDRWQRRCICCRRRFPTVADRAHHEHVSHNF